MHILQSVGFSEITLQGGLPKFAENKHSESKIYFKLGKAKQGGASDSNTGEQGGYDSWSRHDH